MSIFFKGPQNPLSNLYIIQNGLEYKNQVFNSVEQAYQWDKCTSHRQLNLAKQIKGTTNTFQQMQLGKRVSTKALWEQRKRKVMKSLLLSKAKTCAEYRVCLEESGNKTFVEDTNHPFWGKGKDGKGKNILGVLHCYVRSILRS